jgi:DNA-binding MarR family transcriptional regulator
VLLQEVYSAGTLVGSLVNDELRRGGVDPQLFSFLSWVRLLEPVTPGTLSAETGIPPTTIRDYLRRLRERGDVVRLPNERDGRSYLVKLTPRGRGLVDRGAPLVGAVFQRVEPHLPRPVDEYAERARELREALAAATATEAERDRRLNVAYPETRISSASWREMAVRRPARTVIGPSYGSARRSSTRCPGTSPSSAR